MNCQEGVIEEQIGILKEKNRKPSNIGQPNSKTSKSSVNDENQVEKPGEIKYFSNSFWGIEKNSI